jgi:hypothetical protein
MGTDASSVPWVELRVHGVSGTPPEDMLNRPLVKQVDGDSRSRFFRATDANRVILTGTEDHTIEGFHWGGYTSGSWIQSLWLGLLPIGLINVAAFMLPGPMVGADGVEEAGAVRLRSVALGLLRLLGGLLTMLLSLAVSMTLIDVIAVRWLGTQAWAPAWLVSAAPLLATLAAGACIALLGGRAWFATLLHGRGTRSEDAADTRFTEPPLSATPPTGGADGDDGADQDDHEMLKAGGAFFSPFGSKEFYTGDPETLTLRGLHVAAGFAVPAFLAASVADTQLSGSTRGATLVVLVVVLAVIAVLGDREGAATTALTVKESPAWWHSLAAWITRIAVGSAAVLLVLAAVSVQGVRPTRDITGPTRLPHGPEWSAEKFDEAASLLLFAAGACLVALVIAVVALAFMSKPAGAVPGTPRWHFRPYSSRCAAIPVAALGIFLGVGYSAALVLGVSTLFARQSEGKNGAEVTTELLQAVTYGWGIGVVPVAALVLVLVIQRRRSRDELLRRAMEGFPDPSPYPAPRVKVWRRALASAVWSARVKNAIPAILWTVVCSAGVLTLAMVLHRVGLLDVPGLAYGASSSPSWMAWDAAWVQLGTWLLLGLIGGMVALSRGALRSSNLRRGVNIVWDVISFWPHAVHPFIPTPYSIRVVRDLAQRIRDHLAADPAGTTRQVVVCGHSQGSLICFAALNLLSDEECSRISLLTFGSQLRVIFPRAFPLYVNYSAIEHLYRRLDQSWINLYRETDPLAGPVLSWNHTPDGQGQSFPDPRAAPETAAFSGLYRTRRHGSDWLLMDPVPRAEPLQDAPVETLHKHSHFWANPEWETALAELRRVDDR